MLNEEDYTEIAISRIGDTTTVRIDGRVVSNQARFGGHHDWIKDKVRITQILSALPQDKIIEYVEFMHGPRFTK